MHQDSTVRINALEGEGEPTEIPAEILAEAPAA
jgi:hypothetical protein